MKRAALVITTIAGLGLAPLPGTDLGGPGPLPIRLGIMELVIGADIEDINADYGLTTIDAIEAWDLYLQQLPGYLSDAEFEALGNDPRVVEAEIDNGALAPEAAGGDTQPIFFYVSPVVFDQQYATELINVGEAQQMGTGAGIIIAVLDTGLDADHELLVGQIAPGGYNFVDDNFDIADVGAGLDIDDDGQLDELVGHGTFVSGIIATVAPDAFILPIRVLDSEGYGSVFRIVQGIYHAMDQGADVINLSLGTKSHNHILRNAVAEAYNAGIVVVAAAGDDDHQHPAQVPAGEEATIGVASTDAAEAKSETSNYGDHISLSAPGQDIVSAMPDDLYAQTSGTSASTALVSGTVALLRAADPDATPAEIETYLLGTAVDIEDANPDYCGLLGAGRLNVAAALAQALPTGPGPGPVLDPSNGDILPPALLGLPGMPDLLDFLGDR